MPQVDYDKLAKQMGGAHEDDEMDKLAAKMGGAVEGAQAKPEPPTGFYESAKSYLKGAASGFADSYKASTAPGILSRVADAAVLQPIIGLMKRTADSKAPLPFKALDAIGSILIPDAALEHAQQGDYTGAAGVMAANTAMLAGPKILKGVGKVAGIVADAALPRVATALGESSLKQYGKVLNATKAGNKYLSQNQIAPGLVERGVMAPTLKSLGGKASANVESLGAQIGDYWDQMPDDAQAPVGDIINRVRADAQEAHTIPGPDGKPLAMGGVAKSAMESSESLATFLEDASTPDASGVRQIPVKRLREVRQYFDKIASDGKRYQGANLSDASKAETYGRVADAIREEFAKTDPSLDALNKEFSFWKNAQKVVNDTILRKEGQAKPLTQTIAEGAGLVAGATGGHVGSILGKYGLGALTQLTSSTGWRTVSAVAKDRLAKAIARGSREEAMFQMNKIKTAMDAPIVPTQRKLPEPESPTPE